MVSGPCASTQETAMPEFALTLTAEEHQYLVEHLETVLKDTRVEEHRTRTPTYRESVLQREKVIQSVLTKLRPPRA
jgi:hypothetical protein